MTGISNRASTFDSCFMLTYNYKILLAYYLKNNLAYELNTFETRRVELYSCINCPASVRQQ